LPAFSANVFTVKQYELYGSLDQRPKDEAQCWKDISDVITYAPNGLDTGKNETVPGHG
jgi:hypothetical protein